MDGYDKFDIDPFTLTKSDFRIDLTGEDISDCDYEFYKEMSEVQYKNIRRIS